MSNVQFPPTLTFSRGPHHKTGEPQWQSYVQFPGDLVIMFTTEGEPEEGIPYTYEREKTLYKRLDGKKKRGIIRVKILEAQVAEQTPQPPNVETKAEKSTPQGKILGMLDPQALGLARVPRSLRFKREQEDTDTVWRSRVLHTDGTETVYEPSEDGIQPTNETSDWSYDRVRVMRTVGKVTYKSARLREEKRNERLERRHARQGKPSPVAVSA